MPYKDIEKARAHWKAYQLRVRQERPEHERARARRNAAAARARDPEGVRAYRREWMQKAIANESPEAKQKRLARKRISYRIGRGTMPHASVFLCSDCDRRATEYHHEIYEQWWGVEALCRECHERRHHP